MSALRRIAAALALTAVSACAHRGAPAHRPAQATAIPAAPSAPAWSAASVRSLQAQLREALAPSALATSGIAIVDAGARPLFERRETARR